MKLGRPVYLVLENGDLFPGYRFGAQKTSFGEIVFNTSMSGYQEILTDPSYAGQIILMTYPHQGNYGINSEDNESLKPFCSGFIVKEYTPIPSNWRSECSLEDFLSKWNIPGVYGVDTRALTKSIRSEGAMRAIITEPKPDWKNEKNLKSNFMDDFEELFKDVPSMEGQNLVEKVTTDSVKTHPSLTQGTEPKFRVAVYDFGVKWSSIRILREMGCECTIFPANTSAEKVKDLNPDGIFLSNGPGDPAALGEVTEEIKKLVGTYPIFGICMGHQLLSRSLGAKTYKLKFGHHGGNQPVLDLKTKKVEITAQNHGFAVDPDTLPKTLETTHVNLNDKTIEGVRSLENKCFSVQYHPEAGPGPHDSHYLFNRFIDLMAENLK